MDISNYALFLGIVLIVYLFVMFAISYYAETQIHNTEDFLVAGRKLPLSLAWATILATWFGAATVLTQSDEVRQNGLQMAALDPLGAGLCLILAGLFFAVPLWKMGLLTISDFFRKQFGPKSEFLSACIMVPSYFGWIATQFKALAQVLQLIYGIDETWGILLVAVIGMSYTLMGGMWSVTLTDAVQISLVLLGLIVLGCITVLELGGGEWQAGINQIFQENSLQIPVLGAASAGGINVISDLEGWENPDRFTGIPTETLAVFSLWFGWVCIGMLGNIPGQDLMQRVFSAKSANTARLACILAGILYLAFGLIPVGLALAVFHLQPWVQQEVITHLARSLLHPIPFTIFFLALISAILSTIDSAILSPASVLSQNIFSRIGGDRLPSLVLNRLSVVLVTAASVGMTFSGESAYELLEGAYELTMVGLFVPLAFGIYLQPRGEWPAFGAMFSGTALWLVHYLMGWELLFGFIPLHMAIAATLLAAGVYFLLWRMSPIKTEISDN